MFLAFAGGVGGAKLALGLSKALPPDELLIVVNTGDDFDHLGLRICPDLDTVTYTLAGIANTDTGWGLAGETWNFLDALEQLGGETWFRLGDRDLATHIERTRRLRNGETLSSITTELAAQHGIDHAISPATNDDVRTIVQCGEGKLSFQDYFVRRQCEPDVVAFEFIGAETASPAPPVAAAFESRNVEGIIFCPSNPYVSIGPIVAVPAIRDFLIGSDIPVIAVSPIVGGRALKGPAAKMMGDLGLTPSALSVAEHYREIITGIVIDASDAAAAEAIRSLDLQVAVTNTVMTSDADKTKLARDVIDFVRTLPGPQ